MRNVVRVFSIFLLIFVCSVENTFAATPSEVLDRVATKVKAAKTINISFGISGGGKNAIGELTASGTKFHIKAAGMETWYNGKDMYTFNPSTKETTVVKPTQAELAEVNPLVYINVYNSYFTPTFSKNNQSGKYIIDLKPKSRKAPVKKVTVFINSTSNLPEKFIITSLDGSVSSVVIKKVSLGSSNSEGTFDYPKKKFPNVTVVDLR